MLFGHGLIFRDLNAVLDTHAVSVVLASGIPMVVVPYSAARQVSMTGSDLDRVTRTGPAGGVGRRAQPRVARVLAPVKRGWTACIPST